jgi:protease-4
MKQFFKFFFASLLGFLVGLFLLFIIVAGIIAAAVQFGEKEVQVKDNTILKIKLDKPIPDRASDNPFANFNPTTFEADTPIGLDDILDQIERAAKDDRISGIYLKMTGLQAYMATIEEIRDALIDFKESGKFIIAYGDMMDQRTYYLASVANRIIVNPEGMFLFNGLQGQVTFIKGTLAKLGIEAQVIRHGKFKAAVEPLIQEEMSVANREQIKTYISTMWDHMVDGIALSRGADPAQLNAWADSLSLTFVEDAVALGMIDDLKYETAFLEELADSVGAEKIDDIEFISLAKYKKAASDDDKLSVSRDRIAVIFAEGEIVDGKGEEGNIGGETYAKILRKAREDENVKAIVLRVNSPGGSGFASEVILQELLLTKAEKPVVASFGGVAASGGYYIACAADSIIASPNTITGSIGVFGVIPNFQELFQDKIGLRFDRVMTNTHADFLDVTRPLNPMERKVMTKMVEDMYADFIQRVADGREMQVADVDSIGQGRVWAGKDALALNLIDKYGGLNEAIAMAAGMAGLEDYRLKKYPELKDPFEKLMESLGGNVSAWMMQREMGPFYPMYQQVKRVENIKGLQARMDYDIEIR